MTAPNFELITELQTLTRRDFTVADSNILKPLSALPLVEGEWLELDANYKLARGTGTSPASFIVHTERGRYDTQAIGKTNVLFAGQWEGETSMIEGAIGTFVPGYMVKLAAITAGANTGRVGIKICTAGVPVTNDVVVGVVTKVNSATGKVRILHMSTAKSN
jgi:hypothetical protein